MLLEMNHDTFLEICKRIALCDAIFLVSTCHELHKLADDEFFHVLAYSIFSDEFWTRASTQSMQPPCDTWRAELMRIERFQRLLEQNCQPRWTEDVFFRFWEAERSARLRVRKKVAIAM